MKMFHNSGRFHQRRAAQQQDAARALESASRPCLKAKNAMPIVRPERIDAPMPVNAQPAPAANSRIER
jgi:hypothetical protein